MVRVSNGRPRRDEASVIAGGFVLVRVSSLMLAWRACRARPLGVADFRAWLACHELRARRGAGPRDGGRSPRYTHAELAKLLGVTARKARASVRRLADAALIEWSDSAIEFPGRPSDPDPILDAIGGGRGDVAVPRRVLRFLTNGASPVLIATALGVLLRCLSRRKGGFDGRGRVKASWVAGLFGVSPRQVQAARRRLVELGWIAPEASEQWTLNRWGRPYRIDLRWAAPRPQGRPEIAQPRPDPRPPVAQPCLDREPSPEGGIKDQEPAQGGPAGDRPVGEGGGPEAGRSTWPDLATCPPTPAAGPTPAATGPLPPPRLADVRVEDLEDTGRLLDLHRQAMASGLVGAAEADRQRFAGAAEHALAVASRPEALFAWIVLQGRWRHLTQADEDSARRRLKAHDSGPARTMVGPSLFPPGGARDPGGPGPSEDARIVREARAAMIRAGIFRDPWPWFRSSHPGWTRERWDRALVALGLA